MNIVNQTDREDAMTELDLLKAENETFKFTLMYLEGMTNPKDNHIISLDGVHEKAKWALNQHKGDK